MPSIGFGDEDKKELTEEQIEQRSEEIRKAQSAKPEREHIKLSQKRLTKLREIYSESVVHDYGDAYHKSADELKSQNEFYELYQEINGKKRNYRRISDYILAYRRCLNFLYAVAEKQEIYSVDEFVDLYSKGKIKVNGMYTPAYKGKDRKRISQKALMEYILSNGDPEKFIEADPIPDITSKEALDEMREKVFKPDQYKRVIESAFDTDPEDVENTMIDPEDPKSYEGKPVATDISKEDQKKLFSKNPGLSLIVKEVSDRSARMDRRGYAEEYVSDFELDDLKTFDKYNRAYGVADMDPIPEFTGKKLTKKAYKNYKRDLKDWEMRNIRVRVDGRYRTLEEQNDADTKAALDKAGINVRMLWNNQEQDRKIKSYLKKSKKREEDLRRKLAKMESISKGKDDDDRNLSDAEKYDRWKALEKEEKKEKRKPSKKNKKAQKIIKKSVKNKKKTVDNFILGVTGNEDKSLKDYRKRTLDFTFKRMQKDTDDSKDKKGKKKFRILEG